MDTCILMPPELSLILLPHPDPSKIFEMSVTLWSNCTLKPGKVFKPDDGRMTSDKLEVYGILPLKDTRDPEGVRLWPITARLRNGAFSLVGRRFIEKLD
ncbi:hypothetical protein LSH36_347g01006 [Paralvinella palmiformis]|uniref:Uncharacterized protein n=1 Tax=Paralvinella palmiformis TaxID=53620 RepID=A0AAD9JFV4_9ANNE|nr:hypothetical protein LSH36_347g01006 [Paralvinella palmiformis]